MNPKAKTATKSNIAAINRKQKSRAAQKAANLVRLQVHVGRSDKRCLNQIAKHLGVTLSDLITTWVKSSNNDKGEFEQLEESGCVWESTDSKLDLLLTPAIAQALQKYDPVLTAGEVIEILLGRMLEPSWDPDADHPVLLGTFLDGEICVVEPVQMFNHAQSYFRRRNRDFIQAVEAGQEYSIWSKRELHYQWSKDSLEHEWKEAKETGDLKAVSRPIKGALREKGVFSEDVGLLAWLETA